MYVCLLLLQQLFWLQGGLHAGTGVGRRDDERAGGRNRWALAVNPQAEAARSVPGPAEAAAER